MKRFLLLFLISTAAAQTSNVTATITDSDGQAWANGTVQVVFIPTPGVPGPYTWSGGPGFPQKFSTSMNGSGVFTISIPDNAFIAPKGSMWQFTLCSNTSASCQNITTPVTGPSPNLSSTLNGQLVAPRFGPGQFAFGYTDVEVSNPTTGSTYFNVTTLVQRIWTGSVWQNNSGGGGGGSPGSPFNSLQGNNIGSFAGVPNTSVNFSTGRVDINNLTNIRYVTPAYNWSQSPIGSLTGGILATVTLTPCPIGVNNTDTNLAIYIAGTGTPEVVYPSGGTCTSGLASGTLTFTPVNSHSAGFTIQSGTAGLREAYMDNGKNDQSLFLGPSPANGGGVTNPYIMYAPFVIDNFGPVAVYCNNAILEVNSATNQNSAIMITGTQSATFHECRGAANGSLSGVAITNTVCATNVSTITSTLNPPVGTRVDVQFTFDTHYWGVHTVATTSGSSWTYTDNQCSGAISPGLGSIPSQATAGNNAPIYAMIEDQNGFGVRYEDFHWGQPGSISGHLNNGLVIEGDQHFVVTGNTGSGLGGCSSAYCGSWIYMPGPFNGSNPPQNANAAVPYITNNSMSLNCNWNGVTAYNGNTVSLINNVIQGQSMWSFNGGIKRGGFGTNTIIDLYDEVGACSNPIYAGTAGVIQYGQSLLLTGGEGPAGGPASFATGGSTEYYYWIVVHDTIGGTSAPLLIGTCTPTGTTCNVSAPRADDNGTVTYDFLRSTDQDNAPTTTTCTGGSTSACGSVQLGVSQSTILTTTFTDSVASNTTSYTVAAASYTPTFPFFPGAVVLVGGAILDCYGVNVNSQACLQAVAMNGYGPVHTDAPARKFTPGLLQVFTLNSADVSSANASGHSNSAMLLENVGAQNQTYASKGRLNFFISGTAGVFAGSDVITLADSNASKTFAHEGLRPTLDNADTGIGFDTAPGQPSTYGLHIAAPVSISNYINTARDGSSWKQRLTSSLFETKVASKFDNTVTVTGGTGVITLASTTVGALPPAATNSGAIIVVSDSTPIATQGQTCVGSSGNVALAFSNGNSWSCFSAKAGGTAAGLAGTGACATITTQTGGAFSGQATCTGTTGASTLTITPGTTATNGWVCSVYDQTTRANLLQQTANNATTCTLTATSVTANDVFVFTATPF